MIIVERYIGPFTCEQVDCLGGMLGYEDHETAKYIAERIYGALIFSQIQDEKRKSVPDLKIAKRRLEQIAKNADRLVRDLKDEPLAISFAAIDCDLHDRRGPDGTIIMSQIAKEDEESLENLIGALRRISLQASEVLKNDRLLRARYFLPSAKDSGRSTLALILWPQLFELWVEVGKPPAQTAYGPLHRFVTFVHKAIEAPEPIAATLRDAVVKWKHDGGMARVAARLTWEEDGED